MFIGVTDFVFYTFGDYRLHIVITGLLADICLVLK